MAKWLSFASKTAKKVYKIDDQSSEMQLTSSIWSELYDGDDFLTFFDDVGHADAADCVDGQPEEVL